MSDTHSTSGPSDPADQDTLLQAGLQLFQASRLEDAERVLGEVLRADPAHADALHILSLVRFRRQDAPGALDLISQSLAVRPDAGTYSNRAAMQLALGAIAEAAHDLEAATGLAPEIVGHHLAYAEALLRLNRLEPAIAAYDKAIVLQPVAELYNRRGAALLTAGRLADSAADYSRAVALEPRNAAAHRGLGHVLYAQGAFEPALASYDTAITLEPESPATHYNRGNTLKVLARSNEALASFEAAIAQKPDFAVAHHNRALSVLHQGDLAEGFQAYEWRKRCPSFEDPRYSQDHQWLGAEDLAGKTLLIYSEFYQGDLIQFCRYARMAERRGARVSLAAPVAMHRLLQTLSPTVEFLSEDATAEGFDYRSALLSLPLAFGTTLDNLPGETGYLHAEAARVYRWRAQIGTQGFKVGVVWQGSTLPYSIPLQRSYPLSALAELSRLDGVRLISLQKFNGLDQLENLPPNMTVETLTDFDTGPDIFLDTAAAMACCDLVIAMDTSIAHLAGALGVRAWIALPHIADWRWLAERSDCPWYPSLTLFRQRARNDWDSVFSAMTARLQAELLNVPQGR